MAKRHAAVILAGCAFAAILTGTALSTPNDPAPIPPNARMIEAAELKVLARHPTGAPPTQSEFDHAGIYSNSLYGWPRCFHVSDIEGNGSPDVIIASPATTRSDGFLYRRVRGRWHGYCFAVNLPIVSIETFHITRHGPVAIVVMSMESEYRPELWLDVFVWRRNALRNVLSTTILDGFQWDHLDLDHNGTQSIRLYSFKPWEEGSTAPGGPSSADYRWNGLAYVLARKRKL